MMVKLGDVDCRFECGVDVGYVVYLWRRWEGNWGCLTVVFVCPPFVVEIGEGDLAAVEGLEVVIAC